jgi:hypothetical protein
MSDIKDSTIIEFVRRFTEEKHYPPSLRDFKKIGITSTSYASFRIDKLVEAGRLGRDFRVARSLYVKEE